MEISTNQNILDCSAILKADLFSTLLEGEHRSVVSHSSLLQLRKGGILFRAGEKASHFFLVIEGGIRIYKTGSDEIDNEVARFASGDVIGDFDFARGADYDACAEATEDSYLIMFPGYGLTLEQFALEVPHLVSKILLSSIDMMTNRIKKTRKLIMENMTWVQEIQRKAYEDPGTGLWKQTFLSDEINRILEEPSALLLLKPDRFKILVDSRGHDAGDEAMVRIALILKNITRRLGRGWPLRFKSNETGLFINKCDLSEAKMLAENLHKAIAELPAVAPLGNIPAFQFTGTIVWGVWPQDEIVWDSLLQGSLEMLLDSWRAGGDRVVHFVKKNTNSNDLDKPPEFFL